MLDYRSDALNDALRRVAAGPGLQAVVEHMASHASAMAGRRSIKSRGCWSVSNPVSLKILLDGYDEADLRAAWLMPSNKSSRRWTCVG